MKRLLMLAVVAAVAVGCARVPDPKRVAIMDFESTTIDPEADGLNRAIPELLTNLMANAERTHIVDRQDMNRYLGARYPDDQKRLRYERWKEIGERLDIDYFIAGAISKLENNFIINARLYSVYTGQVVPASAKQVSVARASDIYPATGSLARHFIYQVQRRQPIESP